MFVDGGLRGITNRSSRFDTLLWWKGIGGWIEIVKTYSTCRLTCARDKLVALSGIFRLIHQQTNEQYLAGLWRKNIEFQLCWYLYYPTVKVSNYLAPSRPWASVDGVTNYTLLNYIGLYEINELLPRPFVRFHQADITSLTPNNPFGEVSAATLQTDCRSLLEGTMTATGNYGFIYSSTTFVGHKVEIFVYLDHNDSGLIGVDVEIFLLPVAIYMTVAWTYEGLLLRATSGKKGEYESYGWWQLDGKNPSVTFGGLLEKGSSRPPSSDHFSEVKFLGGGSVQKIILLV